METNVARAPILKTVAVLRFRAQLFLDEQVGKQGIPEYVIWSLHVDEAPGRTEPHTYKF
jgi:hypothetical protein